MKKRVCITGAAGFLGIHLVKSFVDNDWDVSGITEFREDIEKATPVAENYGKDFAQTFQSIAWHFGDIRNRNTFKDVFKGMDYVVHCAGLVHGNREDLFAVNKTGTRVVLEEIMNQGVKRFCYISTIEALGRYFDKNYFDEKSEYSSRGLNSHYAQSKRAGEEEVLKAGISGLNVLILIPPVIVGPSNWNEGFGRTYKKIWEGKKYSPRGKTAFIDARDLAAIAVLGYNKELRGRYLVNEGNYTYQHAYREIGTYFGMSNEFPISKSMKLRLWLFFGQIMDKLFKFQIIPNSRLVLIRDIQKNSYSAEKFRSETNFQFIPLEESLHFAAKAFIKDIKKPKGAHPDNP